ncbi:hypothetical protein TPHA_0N00230 [Tetrapisispora phaffii CBS 4417]|uniref:Zn(2)-C6 fungal-type domain-containing protein n=1 Tax=Tetrapisispora phaffii (strain ATCC 24235 / CBS 4417 / NBRC 1672 / NRRL Y-8282 / UCD 70-5) TaxID=1071381 RepID=G8C0X6_TETPH|nr:hypothetical protein TPHA_0N00230 [Tetrapisispora phaffii CBS 4417]CCE65804.1 hypothetical protein TPHA_0N00230 [Tetrapisispora phaffii CBS 4417]
MESDLSSKLNLSNSDAAFIDNNAENTPSEPRYTNDEKLHRIRKKRNRISFVCQHCRKSKTKCDKKQPHCARCIKHGIQCVYDIEFQVKPKTPSKTAIIKRLEADLQNYKSQCMSLAEQLEQQKAINSHITEKQFNTTATNTTGKNTAKLDRERDNETSPQNDSEVEEAESINFYECHPSLIINGIMKREVKPLAENYIILQDKFLSVLVSSIFLDPFKNSIITALSDNSVSISSKPSVRKNILKLKEVLLKHNHSKQQKNRISDFFNRILQKNSLLTFTNSDNVENDAAYKMKNNITPSSTNLQENTQIYEGIDSTDSESQNANDTPGNIRRQRNTLLNLGVSQLSTSMFNNFEHQYLEDYCTINKDTGEVEYSQLMKCFISDFEQLLPPYDVIMNYKAYFYESIYPNLPFLDKELFEDTLSLILFPLDEDEEYKEGSTDSSETNVRNVRILLGKSRLRTKLENLGILIIILKLSYISLRFNEFDSVDFSVSSQYISKEMLDKYPMNNDSVLLVERLLVAENYCACANENIICCLLYIWAFFVFSPEEGDFFLEHPTDILSGVIAMLGNAIGLHRDPLDFPQLQRPSVDSRILNYRRILWLAIVTTSCLESSLKGRHPIFVKFLTKNFIKDINSPDALETYMARVRNDLGPTGSEKLLKTHEISFKRMQLSILISTLDSLTLTYGKSFKLSEFETARKRIKDFLDNQFPILDFKGNNNTNDWINQLTKVTTTEYSITLHSRMMASLVLLRFSIALFLHYETLYNKTGSIKLLPYYKNYFYRSCIDCLTLASHFEKFFNGGYGTKYSNLTSYNVTKTAQLALPSVIFSILSIVIRLELAGVTLLTDYKNLSHRYNILKDNESPESKSLEKRLNELIGKITVMNSLKIEFEKLLTSMYHIASEHLRFTYFSVFKMLTLFDVIMHKIKKGHLLTTIIRMCQSELLHPKFVETFSMTLNLDLSKRDTLLEDLKKTNHLINISVEDLNEIYQTVSSLRKNNDTSSRDKKAANAQSPSCVYGPIITNLASLATPQSASDINKQQTNSNQNLESESLQNSNLTVPEDVQQNSGMGNGAFPQPYKTDGEQDMAQKNFDYFSTSMNKIPSSIYNQLNQNTGWLNGLSNSTNSTMNSTANGKPNDANIQNNVNNNMYPSVNLDGTSFSNDFDFIQNRNMMNSGVEETIHNNNLPEQIDGNLEKDQYGNIDAGDPEIHEGINLRGIFGGLDLFDYDFLFGGEK